MMVYDLLKVTEVVRTRWQTKTPRPLNFSTSLFLNCILKEFLSYSVLVRNTNLRARVEEECNSCWTVIDTWSGAWGLLNLTSHLIHNYLVTSVLCSLYSFRNWGSEAKLELILGSVRFPNYHKPLLNTYVVWIYQTIYSLGWNWK